MNITLARIDDRLIHGQVTTVWSKVANAQRIIICNDEVYNDEVRGNDSNLLIVFYVQIMPDDFVMQLHRF